MMKGLKDILRSDEFPQPEYIPLHRPVLLCHGFGIMANAIQPSLLHKICMLYRSHCITAFAPSVVPYAAIDIRAKAWVETCDKILSVTGSEKLHIVAHSMGGLDMRYALSHLGLHERVQTLTTVATPHRGTSLANLTLNAPDKLKQSFMDLMNWMGDISYPSIKSNASEAIHQLTPGYVQNTFNPDTPDHPDVTYYSVTTACGKGTEYDINNLLYPFNSYIHENEGVNDGYISAESAMWGRHLFSSRLNHVEQIGLNLPKKLEKEWDDLWIGISRNLVDFEKSEAKS